MYKAEYDIGSILLVGKGFTIGDAISTIIQDNNNTGKKWLLDVGYSWKIYREVPVKTTQWEEIK